VHPDASRGCIGARVADLCASASKTCLSSSADSSPRPNAKQVAKIRRILEEFGHSRGPRDARAERRRLRRLLVTKQDRRKQ
jgi:hypothetical protein